MLHVISSVSHYGKGRNVKSLFIKEGFREISGRFYGLPALSQILMPNLLFSFGKWENGSGMHIDLTLEDTR